MVEIAAVLAAQEQGQDVFVEKLKTVFETCLIDYYAGFWRNRYPVLALDPMTAAQIASYHYKNLLKKVSQDKLKWLARFLDDFQWSREKYAAWMEKLHLINVYRADLSCLSWSQPRLKSFIRQHLDSVENERVSLQEFLSVMLYLSSLKGWKKADITAKLGA